jgi:digeranylgeranylglycerophospholipid reductase
MKIAVIGAGPAGSYYASKAAGEHEVLLFEEHKSVGNPVACTGILTESIKRVTDFPKDLIVSYIDKFKIIAPNGKATYIDLKKRNYVLDRARFDQWLFGLAKKAGVKVHLGERFESYTKKGKQYLVKTNKSEYLVDMLVGSDGPRSAVAKAAGILGERRYIKGWQARVKMKGLEEGVTVVHLNLGEFSWIVPETKDIARVGVLGDDSAQLKKDYMKILGDAEILEDQSGTIPLYNPKQQLRKQGEEIYLLGDAATQVKATTYGGIIYGMLAGTYLSEEPHGYEKKFNGKLGRDLWVSLKMRDMMNHMNEEQSNELIKIFQKKHNIDVLGKHDRDFPSKFIVQLLMKETKLWKLGFDIFKNKIFGS